jgi:hypothetical protein
VLERQGVPDAAHLRAANNGEQIKIIECSSRLRKGEPQPFPQHAFREIHLEDRREAEGHIPGGEPLGLP